MYVRDTLTYPARGCAPLDASLCSRIVHAVHALFLPAIRRAWRRSASARPHAPPGRVTDPPLCRCPGFQRWSATTGDGGGPYVAAGVGAVRPLPLRTRSLGPIASAVGGMGRVVLTRWIFACHPSLVKLGEIQASSETRLKHVRKSLARLTGGLGNSLVSSLDAVASSVLSTLIGPKRRSASAPPQCRAEDGITGGHGRGTWTHSISR